MFRILVVDDDKNVRFFLKETLELESYTVFEAKCAEEALEIYGREYIDLVIVDIMMPRMNGYELTETFRLTNKKIPILMVSAKQLPEDRKRGFIAGIDDYMSKPFSILELMARVKTNLRRANLFYKNVGDFSVDNNTYRILYKQSDLNLTLKEFKLLKILIGKAGVTLDREDLFREVWGEDFMGETRTLDTHIATLRDKIENAGGKKDVIVTVRGIGYRFDGI